MNLIMSDAETRAKKLDSFNRTFSNMLENEMAEHKRVLRQKYSHQFESELSEAESCAKGGDSLGAMEHNLQAQIINDFLKMLE